MIKTIAALVGALLILPSVHAESSAEPSTGLRSVLSQAKSNPADNARRSIGALNKVTQPPSQDEMNPLKRSRKLAVSNQVIAGGTVMGNQQKSTKRALTLSNKLHGHRQGSGNLLNVATVRSNTALVKFPGLGLAQKIKERTARQFQEPRIVSNTYEHKCSTSRISQKRALQKAGGSKSLGCR